MAQGDSVGRDLDKRTRDLERQKIQPGQGLSAQQIAQNQLQAIQNEQRNNLSQQRLQEQANAQAQQIAVQAAQVGTMETGPAVETLKRYGLTKPRTVRTQSRDIKVAPPNITINTTNNTTTTTGGGPTAGRDIMFRQPQQNASTNKFKAWLSGLLLSQKEENAKREREFDRRDSALVRSSNKMLKRIEAAGRDIATNLNPKVIGTTVGNQFRMLLMIFALGFLAKHWDKVMNVLDKIVGFFKSSLDYFGITNRQEGRPSPFYQDLLTFFGATSEDGGSLFNVLKRLGSEFIDHLKLMFEHAMALRGDAIKAIKFPEIDTGDIFKTLSSIAGYVGNILTAMMDPKKGVQDSIQREVNASMSSVARDSEKEQHKFSDEVKGVRGLKDTSYGDYAAEVRHALTHNALNESGDLRNNTWASLSQGRDLVQAYQNSQNGVIDIARMGGGLQRLQDTAVKEGYVTLDAETINSLFGGKLNPLIQSGDIKPVVMKYVQVKKTDQDLADENADVGSAMFKGGLTGWALDQIPGSGLISAGARGAEMAGQGAAIGAVAGGAIGASGYGVGAVPGAFAGAKIGAATGATVGGIEGYMRTTKTGGAILGALDGAWNRLTADDNILKLVPADDPRPGIALGGRVNRTFYQVNPKALNQLASILTNDSKITEINSGSEKFMKALENNLVARAGGESHVRSRDFDLESGYRAVRNIEAKEDFYREQEKNDAFSRHTAVIWNNAKDLGNRAISAFGQGVSYIGQQFRGQGTKLKLPKAEKAKISNYIMDRLVKEKGLTPSQAAGIVGNLRLESGEFDYVGKETWDVNGPSAGLAQWHDSADGRVHNLTDLKNFAASKGKNWWDIPTQVDFLMYGYKPGMQAIERMKREGTASVEDSAYIWGHDAERFAGYKDRWNSNYQRRADFGAGSLQEYLTAAGQIVDSNTVSSYTANVIANSEGNTSFKITSPTTAIYTYTPPSSGGSYTFTSTDSSVSVQDPSTLTRVDNGNGTFNYTYTGTSSITFNAAAPTSDGSVFIVGDSWAVGMSKYFSGNVSKSGAGVKEIESFVPKAVASGAGRIVVYAGLNSSRLSEVNLTNSYKAMAISAGRTPLYICTLITVGSARADLNAQIPKINKAIVASGAQVIDLFPSSDLYSKFFGNDPKGSAFHLTSEGYRMLANQIKARLAGSDIQPEYGALSDFGEGMISAGETIQGYQPFDVNHNIEEDVKFSENLEKLQSNFYVTDSGVVIGNGYYRDIYGADATYESIKNEWIANPSKMKRDITYEPVFNKADEIWGKFRPGDEEIRKEILGEAATSKEEFRKQWANMSTKEQNTIIRILNRWIKGRSKTLDDYESARFGDKNLMDALDGASKEKKQQYVQLMSTGQYKKAEELLTSYIDEKYEKKREEYARNENLSGLAKLNSDKQKELEEAKKQFFEGKAYTLHGEDYKNIQRELNAARLELEAAQKEQKDANKGYWGSFSHAFTSNEEIDKQREEANIRVVTAQAKVNELQEKSDAYTRVDSAINNVADVDPKILSEYDQKAKKNLELKEKLRGIDNALNGGAIFDGSTSVEEIQKKIAEWKKEKEQLLKDIDASDKSIKALIGDDNQELLIEHKNKIKDMYTRMGKDVTNAEKTYLEIAKTGKNHQEIMLEIGNKFDTETIGYLQNFGEAMLEEKKKAEEAARQQLHMIAAGLANVDVGSVDWDNEYLQGDLNSGQLGKRAKIMSLAERGLPIPAGSITEGEIPPGYAWNQKYNCYLPTDESKWAIKKIIKREITNDGKTIVTHSYKDDYYKKKIDQAAASSATQIANTNSILSQQNITLDQILMGINSTNSYMTVLSQTMGQNTNYMYGLYTGFNTGTFFPTTPQPQQTWSVPMMPPQQY